MWGFHKGGVFSFFKSEETTVVSFYRNEVLDRVAAVNERDDLVCDSVVQDLMHINEVKLRV